MVTDDVAPTEPGLPGTAGSSRGEALSVSTLRGAPVRVNARRVAQGAIALCLVAIAAVSGVLFASGANKNAQINDLRAHGVTLTATVTSCLGLLGGSGSNAVGYTCTGTYRYGGSRYVETIPGNSLHPAGAPVRIVAASDDPRLISTPSVLVTEHASPRVFLAPTILAIVVLAALTALTLRRRSAGSGLARGIGPRRAAAS